METGTSISHIWNVGMIKMMFLPIFQIATRLNSQYQYMYLRFRLKSET